MQSSEFNMAIYEIGAKSLCRQFYSRMAVYKGKDNRSLNLYESLYLMKPEFQRI
jgi:hypothetical protein